MQKSINIFILSVQISHEEASGAFYKTKAVENIVRQPDDIFFFLSLQQIIF